MEAESLLPRAGTASHEPGGGAVAIVPDTEGGDGHREKVTFVLV